MVEADDATRNERMPLPLLLRLCALGIMAPALSEASQGQELHLPHSLPRSPSTDGSISNGLTWCSKVEKHSKVCLGITAPSSLFADDLQQENKTAKACRELLSDIKSGGNTMSNCDNNKYNNIMGLQKAVSFPHRAESVKEGEVLKWANMGRSGIRDDCAEHNIEGSNSDTMGNDLSEEDVLKCLGNSVVNRVGVANDRAVEMKKKQHEIERKTERILRRIRKLECRGLSAHSAKQITRLVTHSCKNLTNNNKKEEENNNKELQYRLLNQQDIVKNMSTTALVNYIKKLEGNDDKENGESHGAKIVVKLNREYREQVENTAGQLATQLRQAHQWLDSDATECSSGGESCDEQEKHPRLMVTDTHNVSGVSIKQRALWKFAMERAAILSRWTWLQTQVADLEQKTRQAKELKRQVRSAKGAVVLGNVESCGTPRHHSMTTTTRCQEETLSPKVGCEASSMEVEPSPALRLGDGYVLSGDCSPKCGDTASVNGFRSDDDVTCVSSRTRPLKSFRKRQLLRSAGLHCVSKKANRLCTVRCGCFPPVTPCIMCGGRMNNVAPVEADVTPMPERIALLDGNFHPVLSFSKDASLGVRVEHLLKGGNWQKTKSQKLTSPARRGADSKHEADGRKKPRLSSPATTKSHRRTRADDDTADRMKRKRQSAQVALAALKRERSMAVHRDSSMDSLDVDDDEETTSSRGTSPCPSLRNSSLQDMRKKKQDQAYDIDNIVIPYSIAAATRVEKLEYKEIPIPRWKVVKQEDFDGVVDVKSSQEIEDFEDISYEACKLRHHVCEVNERAKFFPNGRRSHSVMRSGATSPVDVLSPYAVDMGYDTPPSTPLSISSDDLSIDTVRRDKKRPCASRCASPEPQEEEAVAPFPPLKFPLSQEEYEAMLEENVHTPPNVNNSSPSHQDSESSSVTGSPVDDDPNDPEWTVKQGTRGKLVLKLTKR